jgi:hypothetical protein
MQSWIPFSMKAEQSRFEFMTLFSPKDKYFNGCKGADAQLKEETRRLCL